MKLDESNAKLFAAIIVSDIHQYVTDHFEEYAVFMASEKAKAKPASPVPPKHRKSRKTKV